jgi:hypothetical protein
LAGRDVVLSERWAEVSKRILDQLKSLEDTKDKDRLELVRSLRFVMSVMQRSLVGWMQWVNNPDIMSIFSQKDLEKMTKELSSFTYSFVKYDLEMTKLGAKKGLKAPKKVSKQREARTERFYV